MVGNSRSVESAQVAPHEDLDRRVRVHGATIWRRPIAAHSAQAFARLATELDPDAPVVLDAGCGTGESSERLLDRHPHAQIVGVDKSAHRLARNGAHAHARLHLVRADLQDFWRLARAAGWRLQAHYLLYPNPWPKASQLLRRWHAHPVFPDILSLGGMLEMRTNWRVYAEEFARALTLCDLDPLLDSHDRAPDGDAMTPFERKYLASGQRCYRVRAVAAPMPTQAEPETEPAP